jgi:two-component system sensor histidine kinase DegS
MGIYRDISQRKRNDQKLKRERQALRRMVIAGDHERRLITYEIHDGAAQDLAAAVLNLNSLAMHAANRPVVEGKVFRDALNSLQSASIELRRLMNRLRTPVLDKFGLVDAIADVAAQLRDTEDAPHIDYVHDVQFQRLDPTLENALFRVAQEAITNACRHSRSHTVRVRLVQQADQATLEVRDWGCGFDTETVAENRFGLEGIRERSRLLGGKLRIRSQPGKGTLIRLTFPVIAPK